MSTTIQTTTALPVGTWHVDPTHSHVGFELDYMGGVFRGTFSPVEARFEVDAQGNAMLEGSAGADAVKVQDENLSADLLSPQFFDVARTPILGFEATDIARSGDDVSVSGELTIKGVTRPVDLHGTVSEPLTDAYGRERFNLKLAGAVDRTHFGLDWYIALPTGEPALSNEVRLVAELYFIKG
jgi:polyisoprenoid-binding protein YceI